MDTHLLQDVTTLAMATVIERTDGVKFRLTTSSEDITIDIGDGDGEQVYSAQEGVSRTNIESDSELNVDNLDIVGIFDNVQLKETELRRGLFDFADFKIFVFNHQDTTDGIIKIFRGQLGEVVVTKQDFFRVQVRSIVQVYSKQTGEAYSKDCRADLGDIRCRVPLYWDTEEPANKTDRTFPVSHIAGSIAYSLGDMVAIPVAPANNDCAAIVMNYEDTDGATGLPGMGNIGTHAVNPTVNGTAQIDTAQMPAGGDSTSSLLLDGNSDWLSWADNAAIEFGTGPGTLECAFRINATGVNQTIASKYQATTTNRSWYLRINTSNILEFSVWQTGATLDITITGTTPLTTGVDYDVALVRKVNGDWIILLDGAIEAGPGTPTSDPFDSNADFRIGALESGGVTQFFNGWIDSFRFTKGLARYEGAYTPFTGNHSIVNPTLIWEDYGDRIYECTTAGTSDPCIQIPDTTVTNTHAQGTAVFTANHSWMRFAEVTAVDGAEPRRKFTVTELTPVSGQAVGTNRLPSALGFPNDWMNGGGCFFELGDNAGRVLEVRDFTEGAGSQVIELISDLPFDVVIGDKLRVFPGCDKTNAICISKFNSGPTFVGEPYVPGEDILGQYPDAR
jgi:uncharacterized phage protein (TIGR02218 family)